MPRYEVKLADGSRCVWDGRDGPDACEQFALAHPGVTVVAWRSINRHGMFGGLDRLPRIIEPGDPGWDRGH
jgi:hypothetical protein